MIRLEQLRLDAHLSRQQLAEKSGVSYQTILDLEKGEGGEPQTSTRTKLAEALGARPSELLRPAIWDTSSSPEAA